VSRTELRKNDFLAVRGYYNSSVRKDYKLGPRSEIAVAAGNMKFTVRIMRSSGVTTLIIHLFCKKKNHVVLQIVNFRLGF
jgi:hypothetical protein